MKFNKLYLGIGILVVAVVVVLFAANIFCLKCISPEKEEKESSQHNLSISEVSECRNDTVADFDIELYLNGTPLDKIRNGSYYYQNETIEAKVKPNRPIMIFKGVSLTWHVYKRYDLDLKRVSIYAEACCGMLCKENSTMCRGGFPICGGVLLGGIPEVLVNCTDVWFRWDQTEYIVKTINCSDVENHDMPHNQTIEWTCNEIKNAKVGRYVLRFCYGTDYTPPDIIPFNREYMGICCGEAKCIYKEFGIGQPPYDEIWRYPDEIYDS